MMDGERLPGPSPEADRGIELSRFKARVDGANGASIEEDPRPPAYTDEALALCFAEKHECEIRYVATWGKWLVYDGKRWAVDETLKHFDFARRICRTAAAECNKP